MELRGNEAANINEKLNLVHVKLEEEKQKLDRLAEECIAQGRALASDCELLRQNGIVDALVVSELELKELMEQLEEENTDD